jgi:hypothetical protein
MLYRVAVVSLVFAAACAQGTGGEDEIDARATDGASVDVPQSTTDARIDGPMPIDAAIDAPSGAVPDTCAQAQDITAGAMMAGGVTITGDTTGYIDDVRPDSACTGFLPDGPDAIFSVTVNAGVTITAVATPTTSWDISLELVQPCAATPTCLDGSDVISGPETVTYTTTAQGTYFVVVDGYNPGVAGPYSLNVRVQ